MSRVDIYFVKGSGALVHNNREFIHDNIDPHRVKNNIDYKNELLEEAYKKCFSRAVDKYKDR